MQETTNAAISALTTAANSISADIGSLITTVAPIVLGVAVTVTVLMVGWRIIKKLTNRAG